MTITPNELKIRHRAYWLNLLGWDETSNKDNVTVRIPKRNILDVDGLRALMEQSKSGRIQ
jgi:hypothetical protein